MTAYLSSLKTPPKLGTPAENFKALCERCHGEKGDGMGKIAIYLDPYPRDLTKAGFMNSKPYDRLLRSIREGVAGTSMPAWRNVLDEQRSRELLDYVAATFTKAPRRDLKARAIPEKNPVAMSKESIARCAAVFEQRCAGCHGKKADGKGPNSIDILPHPRNLRNSFFVNSVDDRRLLESILYGIQGTAMPPWIDYGLSNNDAGDLINHIRSLNQEPPKRADAGGPTRGVHVSSN